MADAVLVTTAGLTIITNALLNPGGVGVAVAPKWAQWGVGSSSAPAAGDTDLEDKTGATETPRVNNDYAVATTTLTDDTVSAGALITCNATGKAIVEVGLFNAEGAGAPVTGNTMFLRATFSAINLVAGNSIDFTIDTKFVPV